MYVGYYVGSVKPHLSYISLAKEIRISVAWTQENRDERQKPYYW